MGIVHAVLKFQGLSLFVFAERATVVGSCRYAWVEKGEIKRKGLRGRSKSG
jgi:hypothetical protein